MKNKLMIMMIMPFVLLVVFSIAGCSNTVSKSSVDKAFEQTIDKKLYNITHPQDSQVLSSSNPYDYIKSADSYKDYKYIVSQGDKSLNYMLKKFAGSDKNGLEEYIMAMACSDILKENKNWASGREWYNNYINANRNKAENKLTIEQIKQSYAKTDEKVLSTHEYKNYVLVESQAPTIANHFTLFDLKTGDRDVLPGGINFLDSAKIIDENNIILYSKGTNSESDRQVFPFEIDCTRGTENSVSDGDFVPSYKDIKFPIDKHIYLKGKSKELINDIRVTLNGIQICFGPQDINDVNFYADYTDTPSFDISYDKKAGEFSFKFQDTKIKKALSSMSFKSNSNTFIKSLNLKEIGSSAEITIKLSDAAKYFTGRKAYIEDFMAGKGNDSPYLDIQFMTNADN